MDTKVYTQYYYKEKLIKIRDSEISDAFELAKNMRESDKQEVWRSHHHSPEDALLKGFTNSTACFTVIVNEKPIVMFGVAPDNLLSQEARVWLLASSELEKVKKAFLMNSPKFLHMMLNQYPLLDNWVDIENDASINWLSWLGAEWGIIKPYGVEQTPFQYFRFKKYQVNELVNYFCSKFFHKQTKQQISSLLNTHKDKIHCIIKDNKIEGATLFVRLTNDSLNKLKSKKIDILDTFILNKFLKETGKNIHFLFAAADGERQILKGLREFIKKEQPDTVSWFNQKMTKLNIFNLKGR